MATFLTIGAFWSSVFWILFLLITTYLATYYLVYVRQTNRWKQSNIPFLKPTFLVGHKYFLSASKYSFILPLDQIYKETRDKKLFGFFLGTLPIILLKDEKLINQDYVINWSETFATDFPESEKESQCETKLTAKTKEARWKSSRSAMAPVFSLNWFQVSKFEIINEAIHEQWHQIESEGSQIEVSKVTKNTILNILRSSFGGDSVSYTMKDGLRKIIDDFFEPSYRRMIGLISVAYFPFLQKFETFKFVPRKSNNIMSDILKQQISLRDQMETEKGDFIDFLRSLRGKIQSIANRDKDAALQNTNEGRQYFILPGNHTKPTAIIQCFCIHPAMIVYSF